MKMNSETSLLELELEFQLPHLLAGWPQANYLILLHLSLLIFRKVTVAPIYRLLWRANELIYIKHFEVLYRRLLLICHVLF